MILFKNLRVTAGLTLIEVVMTLVIISLVMTPLFVIQNTGVRSIKHYSAHLQAFFETSYALALIKQKLSTGKPLPANYVTPTGFVLSTQKIPAKTALGRFEDIVLNKVHKDDTSNAYSLEYKPLQAKKNNEQ